MDCDERSQGWGYPVVGVGIKIKVIVVAGGRVIRKVITFVGIFVLALLGVIGIRVVLLAVSNIDEFGLVHGNSAVLVVVEIMRVKRSTSRAILYKDIVVVVLREHGWLAYILSLGSSQFLP